MRGGPCVCAARDPAPFQHSHERPLTSRPPGQIPRPSLRRLHSSRRPGLQRGFHGCFGPSFLTQRRSSASRAIVNTGPPRGLQGPGRAFHAAPAGQGPWWRGGHTEDTESRPNKRTRGFSPQCPGCCYSASGAGTEHRGRSALTSWSWKSGVQAQVGPVSPEAAVLPGAPAVSPEPSLPQAQPRRRALP